MCKITANQIKNKLVDTFSSMPHIIVMFKVSTAWVVDFQVVSDEGSNRFVAVCHKTPHRQTLRFSDI